MNRRYFITLLCLLLSLLLPGCQSYTASQGKEAIAPAVSTMEEKTITKFSVLQEKEAALLKEKALEEEREREALVAKQQAEQEATVAALTTREKELQTSLQDLESRLAMAVKENQQLTKSIESLTLAKDEALLSAQLSTQESAEHLQTTQQQNTLLTQKIAEMQRLIEEDKALIEEQRAQRLHLEKEQEQREAELASLIARGKELQSSLESVNSRLAKAGEENQQLRDTLEEISLAKDEITLGTQLSTQESTERLIALQQQNTLLTQEIVELQQLLEENKTLQKEQREQLDQIEQVQAAQREEQERQHQAVVQKLTDECEALRGESRMLKAQLEEKTLTIEEKVRLELERSEEAKRLEAQRKAKAQAQEAEAKRIASLEEAKRLALEKEWRQIPPLDQITYPRLYKTEKPTTLAHEGEVLRTLMLPLDDRPWKDKTVVTEVHKSISDLNIPIIFVTGHKENVIALVRQMRSNAALFSTGAIITSFPIQELSDYGAVIQYQKEKSLYLIVADLPEYQVVQQFVRGNEWQETQKSVSEKRLSDLQEMLGEGKFTVATLLGASLYEPSHRDWNTFSPVGYRQIDYRWPLSEFLDDEGFYDTYRLTHFSEATSAGNTLITQEWAERVDFLYSRKLLPLDSVMLTIGGQSVPDASGIARFGVLGTFLVP